jgi:hypothetical protein
MGNYHSLEFLKKEEARDIGLYGSQVKEQNMLLDQMDEEQAEEMERLSGPQDPRKPWQFKKDWDEFGNNFPMAMANVAETTNPLKTYIGKCEFGISYTYTEYFVEHKALSNINNSRSSWIIRNNAAEKRKTLPSVGSILLDEHKKFIETMKAELTSIHTMQELYVVLDTLKAHDDRQARVYGKQFHDSFDDMSTDLIKAEIRIRKERRQRKVWVPKAVVVANCYKPAKLVKGLAVAIATHPKDEERLIAEGYRVVARAR